MPNSSWLSALEVEDVRRAGQEWVSRALPGQYPFAKRPDTWMLVGGRASGKTLTGAEWVIGLVHGLMPFSQAKYGAVALVGETLADVREVMIDGPAGIRTISRGRRPRVEVSRRRLLFANGASAQMFSSEDPESLRGPQFDAAWGDEIGKWKNAESCFDMLQFGLRLGAQPRQVLTTTPRATRLVKRLMLDPSVTQWRLATRDNAGNLAPGFIAALERRYGGTTLGRQELDGELIEERDDALWTRAMIEAARLADVPQMRRIVVAVDPPASARRTSDACGIVAAGLDAGGNVIVLADASLKAARPQDWAGAAVALYHALQADCLVAEVNQGGDMVGAVVRAADASVPVKAVRATRGKWLRAEPVAMLYQQGRVRHAGRFDALEDEMCDFGADGLSGGRSPDRVDALVWAVSELTRERSEPRVRW